MVWEAAPPCSELLTLRSVLSVGRLTLHLKPGTGLASKGWSCNQDGCESEAGFLTGRHFTTLPSQEHLAMSGDSFGCHRRGIATSIWWVESRGTAKHPAMHKRCLPPSKGNNYPDQTLAYRILFLAMHGLSNLSWFSLEIAFLKMIFTLCNIFLSNISDYLS